MRRHPLLTFFGLAYLLSWLAWTPLAAAGLGWTAVRFSPYLHLLGGLGPSIAAIVVTGALDGQAGLSRLRDRCFGLRGRLPWIVFAVAAIGGRTAEAFLVTVASGHPLEAVQQGAKDALAEMEKRKK